MDTETEGREDCPVIKAHCEHFMYQCDNNGEVAICYCKHPENENNDEGNCTYPLCPLTPGDNGPVCQTCFNEPATMQNDAGDYLCSDCYNLPPNMPINEDICSLDNVTIKIQGHKETLREKRNRLIDEAATAAHDYARSLTQHGPERAHAFVIYQIIHESNQ